MPPFTKPGAVAADTQADALTPKPPVEETNTTETVTPTAPAVAPDGTPLTTPSGEVTTPVITPTESAEAGAVIKAQQKRINTAVNEIEADPWKMIQDMQKQMLELNKKLEAVADKGRLNQFDEQNRDGKFGKMVTISTYKGKVVQSWSDLVTNTVQLHHNNMHTYDQTTVLSYLDGTSEKVDYQIWQRDKIMVKAIVDKEVEVKENGQKVVIFTVNTEKFGVFEIDSRFVN